MRLTDYYLRNKKPLQHDVVTVFCPRQTKNLTLDTKVSCGLIMNASL